MIQEILEQYKDSSFDEKVEVFNKLTQELYDFIGLNHPALNVHLVPVDKVQGNEYNPNKVAPPEMELLHLSLAKNGFTMPCVLSTEKAENGNWRVVDGFHRHVHAKHTKDIRESLHGYLPASMLYGKVDEQIAATVRHNMARGTHQVTLSAKLVTLLKKSNWTNEKISKELGMDADEVLRLRQITGLAEAFADKEFSQSWEPSDSRSVIREEKITEEAAGIAGEILNEQNKTAK